MQPCPATMKNMAARAKPEHPPVVPNLLEFEAMFNRTLITALFALSATTAHAIQTVDYGWEDGSGTILGSFGTLVDAANVSGPQTGGSGTGSYGVTGAHNGDRFLHIAEAPHSGTPQAYLAMVGGLGNGDVVEASFFGFDVSASASPSMRIWAHYADSADIASYLGSAGGNNAYTEGSGWSEVGYQWTFDNADADALVIEARLYSSPASDAAARSDYWIDSLHVSAPDTARISVAAAVPEPRSYAMLLAGLGMIGLTAARRSKR